jgi:hypothetical protein
MIRCLSYSLALSRRRSNSIYITSGDLHICLCKSYLKDGPFVVGAANLDIISPKSQIPSSAF